MIRELHKMRISLTKNLYYKQNSVIFNKKGVVELTTFSLLILVVIVASLVGYLFIKSNLEKVSIELSYNNGRNFLNNLNAKLNQLLLFDGNKIALPISFEYGSLTSNGSLLIFQSSKFYDGEAYCLNNICFESLNNREVIYLNVSAYNYTFNDIELIPGNYYLVLQNDKENSKIDLTLR